MGTTGVIFAAIAVAWLAYLVPHFARRGDRDLVAETDPAERFSASMRVLRYGTAPLVNQDLSEISSFEVSTPVTRRAAVNDLRRVQRLAAQRRRRVLVVLMMGLTVAVVLGVLGLVPWWSVAVPTMLLAAFVVAARVGVIVMARSLQVRYAAIRCGGAEQTVFLTRSSIADAEPTGEMVGSPEQPAGALWESVPITMPTYVSKPLAPRTVRTIDLSGPTPSATASVPVTADRPHGDEDRQGHAGWQRELDERAASA